MTSSTMSKFLFDWNSRSKPLKYLKLEDFNSSLYEGTQLRIILPTLFCTVIFSVYTVTFIVSKSVPSYKPRAFIDCIHQNTTDPPISRTNPMVFSFYNDELVWFYRKWMDNFIVFPIHWHINKFWISTFYDQSELLFTPWNPHIINMRLHTEIGRFIFIVP